MPAKPSFTVCVIVRDGANTLPRLAASLEEFLARGGEWCVTDTGSKDDSANVARSLGATVFEVGETFMRAIDDDLAAQINARFVAEGEEPIVKPGSRLFDFAAARNHCAGFASNDWVSWADADEAFTRLDLDRIEETIADPDLEHLEYDFVFAHASDNVTPAMAFTQSKMYRRSRIYWTGAVHEIITPLPGAPPRENPERPNRLFMEPSVFHLEHWQQHQDHRSNYLPGLGWDAWMKLANDPAGNRDRQWHYLGREMFWLGRPKSALKLFAEHIEMGGWLAERAQSMIFSGDCCGVLGDRVKQREWYSRAYNTDPSRREALLRLAGTFKGEDHVATAAYAAAALEVPYTPFYANHMADYRESPHTFLYHAKGWTGDIAAAQAHLLQCLKFNPFHPEFNRDVQYYFDYDTNKAPEGWMVAPELLWLHDHAKAAKRVLEVGSWKGRSTHALATGAAKNGGTVWAVDHFGGSSDQHDLTHGADPDHIYKQFLSNTKDFQNIRVRRADSLEAAKQFPDGYFDLLFIDATHLYEPVKADILAWRSKCRGILAGHDFCDTWPEVKQAVLEVVGPPDGVCCSVWWKRVPPPPVNPLLWYLTDCVKKGLPCTFVKLGDGEQACMDGAPGGNCDGHPYSKELGMQLKMAFNELGKMAADRGEGRTRVNVVPFADQPFYNCLLHRNDSNLDAVKALWGAVRASEKPKVFIGPERLHQVAHLLRADFLSIPLVNAFGAYEGIKRTLFAKLKPGTIFIFAASMLAKPLIAQLLSAEPEVTCLDAGSAFDPLFVGQTRTEQLPMDLLLSEYGEWLQ